MTGHNWTSRTKAPVVLALGALGALGAVGLAPATGAAAAPGTGPGELVHVARSSSAPVTAYPASSTGEVSPGRALSNPGLAGTVWDPWGVALGPDGSDFVQSFPSDATTFVFAPASPPARPPGPST